MRLELVSIPTDTLPLDGLYYQPGDREIRGAALIMHGNTMNFYFGPPRFLPPYLTRMGLACLAFNRRGHDILSTRNSRDAEGGAFQTVGEAVADNRFAAAFLRDRGHDPPLVIGHSNGGVLAARHVAHHPQTPGLVLLSAHVGGRGLISIASARGLLACDRLEELARKSEALVAAGQGKDLMILPGWWHVTSAESFIDLMNETPDLLDMAPSIRCPSLFLCGDQEPDDLYPAYNFQKRSEGPCDVVIVDDCDHFYKGREDAVGRAVADWAARALGLDDRRMR